MLLFVVLWLVTAANIIAVSYYFDNLFTAIFTGCWYLLSAYVIVGFASHSSKAMWRYWLATNVMMSMLLLFFTPSVNRITLTLKNVAVPTHFSWQSEAVHKDSSRLCTFKYFVNHSLNEESFTLCSPSRFSTRNDILIRVAVNRESGIDILSVSYSALVGPVSFPVVSLQGASLSGIEAVIQSQRSLFQYGSTGVSIQPIRSADPVWLKLPVTKNLRSSPKMVFTAIIVWLLVSNGLLLLCNLYQSASQTSAKSISRDKSGRISADMSSMYDHCRICKNVVYVLLVLLTVFYIAYSVRGWFAADDFLLLATYEDLAWNELLFKHWGRVITRPIYFHFMQKFFSTQAFFYYLFNGILIWINSILFALIVRRLCGSKVIPLTLLMVVFLIPFTTLRSFAWISVEQHIIPHFFVLIFVLLSFQLKDKFSWKMVALLLLVFTLGLVSNPMSVIAPSIALVATYDKVSYKNPRHIKVLISILFLGGMFAVAYKLHVTHPEVAYTMALEYVWLRNNLSHLSKFLFSYPGVAIFLSLTITVVVVSVFGRSLLPLRLLVISVICASPYLFLVLAKEVYYHSLSFPFFLAAVLVSILVFVESFFSHKYQTLTISLLTMFLLLFLIKQAFPYYHKFYKFPNGRSHVKLVQEIEKLGLKETIICAYENKRLALPRESKPSRLSLTGNYIFSFFNRNGNSIVNGTKDPVCHESGSSTIKVVLKPNPAPFQGSYKFQFYRDGQPITVE